MADIAKIRTEDIDYDIKDSGARTLINEVKESLNHIEKSHVLELQNDIIYDETGTNTVQGCATIGNTLYSCERGSNNVDGGKIVTFDLTGHTYGTTYSNLKIWHAGDATSLDGKIYMASWNADSNRAITVFEPQTQAVYDINPFTTATKQLVAGVSEHAGKLLCYLTNNTNQELLIGAEFFMLDPTDNSTVAYTMVNPHNLPINWYGWTQGSCCDGDKYYILASSPNSLIECRIDDENHTLILEAIYNLPKIDSRGLDVGELQGLAPNPNVEHEFILTSWIKDTATTDVYTTKVYRFNLVRGNPASTKPFALTSSAENGHQAVIVDATSTSLLETGDTYYPFKTLSRAVASATHQNKQWARTSSVIINSAGTYDLPRLFECKLLIQADEGVTINFYQATDNVDLTIRSINSRPKIVFASSYSANQIANNSKICFVNVVLENTARVKITNSIIRTYTCLVNAHANVFELAENSTFYDGSHTAWTFDDASYYAYNVSGGSQLFLFDSQQPFSPSDVGTPEDTTKRIRRSVRRGTVIFPNTYS